MKLTNQVVSKYMFKEENHDNSLVGATVKLLRIDPNIILGLPDDEIRELNSMINQLFEVIEQKNDYVYIEKHFEYCGREISYQSIAVKIKDVEIIKD